MALGGFISPNSSQRQVSRCTNQGTTEITRKLHELVSVFQDMKENSVDVQLKPGSGPGCRRGRGGCVACMLAGEIHKLSLLLSIPL